MKTAHIRAFIETRRQPLTESADIAERIDHLCRAVPEFCLRALADSRTHVSQKSQLLAGVLRSSIERDEIVAQLRSMPDSELLHTLDGLRVRRMNGRRVREVGLRALVGHPRFAKLAACHRLRLVRILKHLLGERTWSFVRRFLQHSAPETDRFLRRAVLRFAADEAQALEAFRFLAGFGFEPPAPAQKPWLIVPWLMASEKPQVSYTDENLRQSATARRALVVGRGMPRETLLGIRGTYHRQTPVRFVRQLAASQSQRAREDGPLVTALKQALTDHETGSLETYVERHAKAVDRKLPVVDVRAAVVLDLSGSAVSSGERLYHPAALGLALVKLLQQYVTNLNVYQVGGSVILNGRGIPRPQGPTDLATAVLEAARSEPDAILVVTDGYENFRQGDVAEVVAGMHRLGLGTIVEQVTPVIATAENLSRRRLGENTPVVPIEHEAGVGELAARLLLASEPEQIAPATLRSVETLLF